MLWQILSLKNHRFFNTPGFLDSFCGFGFGINFFCFWSIVDPYWLLTHFGSDWDPWYGNEAQCIESNFCTYQFLTRIIFVIGMNWIEMIVQFITGKSWSIFWFLQFFFGFAVAHSSPKRLFSLQVIVFVNQKQVQHFKTGRR